MVLLQVAYFSRYYVYVMLHLVKDVGPIGERVILHSRQV